MQNLDNKKSKFKSSENTVTSRLILLANKKDNWVIDIQRIFPGGSTGKESACKSAGDLGSIPGSGRSSGEGNVYPLQCSRLENSMDRGAWWAAVHGSKRLRYDWVRNTLTFHFHLHIPVAEMLLFEPLNQVAKSATLMGRNLCPLQIE